MFAKKVYIACSCLAYKALRLKYGNIVEEITTNRKRSKDYVDRMSADRWKIAE
jgi:hypothetical protein